MSVPALAVSELRKSYGPTRALDAVTLEVGAGRVHAILGENGAGKSTLVRVLSGLTVPDDGTLSIFGAPARIGRPRVAHRLGIRTAYQEISLVKDLTVAQNFLLMEEPLAPLGVVRRRRAEAAVRETLGSLGLGGINPRAMVAALDLPTRQKLEIAHAVSHNPRILLLDEPTASLSVHDVGWLGEIIGRLAAAGTTILFVSHRLQEVREFCSMLSILRNGRCVGTYPVDAISEDEVIERMIGRSLGAAFPPRPARSQAGSDGAALSVHDLSTADGAIGGISFELRPGRVLGLGGLDGMGQRELFLTLFGMGEIADGTVRVRGAPVRLRSPADAIDAAIGISLVPEDRKTEGLLLRMTGTENVTLPSLGRFVRGALLSPAAEAAAAGAALAVVQVPERALWDEARVFSGGNQQKIVIAKWLLTGSRVLLLYDPTRGVDVGTKSEIYGLIRRFTESGGAVLLYSTDVSELVNLCDDVMVIYRGRIVDTLGLDRLSETEIMRAALGQRRGARAGDGDARH